MDQVRTPADIGALARAARTARGWSQQEAADAAGVSRRFVNMVEGGRHANAEVWRVLALLNALGAALHGTVPSSAPVQARTTADTVHSHATATSATDDLDLDAHLGNFRKQAN